MQMQGVCVAVCGRLGSGKDSIADILCKHHGFVNHKFARPLKNAVRSLFELTPEHVDGHLKDIVHDRWKVTPRVLLQWFGTDVMQHGLNAVSPGIGRTFWSDQLRSELLLRSDPAGRFVISDLRFPHELQMLKELFKERLITVRVDRKGKEKDDDHESEAGTSSLDADVEVYNYGTLDDLRSAIQPVLTVLNTTQVDGKTVRHQS